MERAPITTRRSVLQTALGGLGLIGSGLHSVAARADLPEGALASQVLEALPGKQRLLKRSFRPPNYESPVAYLGEVITPNDRFFVRWHLANIPTVSADSWRLSVGGDSASNPYELTLAQLQHEFEPVELVAVCQCAGNRRGLSDPHVPGVQWGNGAMGNARWKGARLKDLLARAGLAKETVEIAFNGADGPLLEATPDFMKSIPVWKALDDNALVAYEMNGEPLPHWNGYPARIIVPGWAATYWMKQVVSIRALPQPLSSFWMNTAYRIPKGKFAVVDRFLSQESETTTPITEILVNSLITNLEPGQRFHAGAQLIVKGIAWDGGAGLRHVEISIDGGRTWQVADLGEDHGRFSARGWQFAFVPPARGRLSVAARATNAQGTTQAEQLIFNPAGYHNNVIQPITVEIV